MPNVQRLVYKVVAAATSVVEKLAGAMCTLDGRGWV